MAPERSCVVCRKKSGKQDFIRFVVNSEGDVLVDPLKQLPGRGAYLHLACVNKQAQGKLSYSLGKSQQVQPFDLLKLVEDFSVSLVAHQCATIKKPRFL